MSLVTDLRKIMTARKANTRTRRRIERLLSGLEMLEGRELMTGTVTSLTSSLSSIVYGQSATLTATVTPIAPATGVPTGQVQFQVDGSNYGAPVSLSGGVATEPVSGLNAGSHTITAVYAGAGTFDASASNNPIIYDNLPMATDGNDNAYAGGYGPLSDSFSTGSQALSLSSITLPLRYDGTHRPVGGNFFVLLQATTGGDIGPGQFLKLIASVNDTSLTSTSTPYTYNLDTPYSLDANTRYWVTVQAGAAGDTSAQWAYNSTTPLTALGVTGEFFSNNAGTYSTVDGPYKMLVSTQLTQNLTVTPKQLTASIIGSPTKIYDGNTNATLTSSNFSLSGFVGTDNLTVTQTSGTYNSKDVNTANTVTATLSPADLSPVGSTLVSNYTVTVATGPGTITKTASTATVTFSPTSPVQGDTVTFTANVSAVASNLVKPTSGTVQFQVDGTNYGSPVSVVNGIATITDASLVIGAHTITALYSGDSQNFLAGSGSGNVTVSPSGASGTAVYVKQDSATQGNWKGVYGADGWNVSQDTSSNNPTYPSYANVTFANAADYTWAATTTNVRALQKAAVNSPEHIAGTWYNADTFSIDVHITDGQTHQVALYGLDWSSFVRSESIQVVDDATGTVLDTRSLVNFHDGSYLIWNISGNVTFRVTNTNSTDNTNAVLSGLFFGGAPSSSSGASYVTKDITTQGNWKGVYGANGWDISQDTSANNPSFPAYANVSLQSASNFTWNASTAETRALEKAATDATSRIAGSWYADKEFSINVSITDGQTHQVALYALDWDTSSRSQTIQAIDTATGVVFDTRSISNFHDGAYLVWNIHGNVTFKVINTGSSNAVISGLFFGGAPVATSTATFVTQNTSTEGTWKGTYGANGFDISQDPSANNPSIPGYATLNIQNASNYTWNASTSNVRALQKAAVGSTDRIAATWFSNNSFNAAVNITDGNTHQVALYALDWDNANRTETIQVLDTATGAVLDTRALSSFQNGVYYVWNVSGNVTFKVINTSNTNAVLSGLFFG